MQKKSTQTDLAILEQLPIQADLRLLVDRFKHFKQPRKKVFDLVRRGDLEMVTRGHYINLRAKNVHDIPLEVLANALYFPSYVSAEWALQHYGLITERVSTLTSVTPRKSNTFATSFGRFRYDHLHAHRYPFGYILHPSLNCLIATPEKALLDYIKLRYSELTLQGHSEILEFLTDHLRVKLNSLLDLIEPDHAKDILMHYHRNCLEYRLLKWLISQLEQRHG